MEVAGSISERQCCAPGHAAQQQDGISRESKIGMWKQRDARRSQAGTRTAAHVGGEGVGSCTALDLLDGQLANRQCEVS